MIKIQCNHKFKINRHEALTLFSVVQSSAPEDSPPGIAVPVCDADADCALSQHHALYLGPAVRHVRQSALRAGKELLSSNTVQLNRDLQT